MFATATLTIIDNQPCVRTEGLLNEQKKPERKVFCTNKEGGKPYFLLNDCRTEDYDCCYENS